MTSACVGVTSGDAHGTVAAAAAVAPRSAAVSNSPLLVLASARYHSP